MGTAPVAAQRAVRALAQRLERLRSARPGPRAERMSSGVDGIDRLLADGGLRRGTLVDWLSPVRGGAGALALRIADHLCRARQSALVVIDRGAAFYPLAARQLGVDIDALIVARPASHGDALWAWEQSLRCPGVGAVWGALDAIDGRAFRRLQLAAEAGGGVGMLLRPATAREQPSWAQTRLWATPIPSSSGQRMRIENLRGPAVEAPGSIVVELDDETGVVRVVSELGDSVAPTRSSRAARASGRLV